MRGAAGTCRVGQAAPGTAKPRGRALRGRKEPAAETDRRTGDAAGGVHRAGQNTAETGIVRVREGSGALPGGGRTYRADRGNGQVGCRFRRAADAGASAVCYGGSREKAFRVRRYAQKVDRIPQTAGGGAQADGGEPGGGQRGHRRAGERAGGYQKSVQ